MDRPSVYNSDEVRPLGCDSGPLVSIDGRQTRTRISTSADAVVAGEVVRATLCGHASMPAGEVDVDVAATFSWLPLGVLLWRTDGSFEAPSTNAPPAAVPVEDSLLDRLSHQGSASVDLSGGTTERTLTFAFPAGDGWEARGEDGPLRPVVVDGWAQGWLVPEGVETAEISYSPAATLGGWAAAGAGAWGLVVLLAIGGSGLSVLRSVRRSR